MIEAKFFVFVVSEFEGMRDLINMYAEEDDELEKQKDLKAIEETYEDIRRLTYHWFENINEEDE